MPYALPFLCPVPLFPVSPRAGPGHIVPISIGTPRGLNDGNGTARVLNDGLNAGNEAELEVTHASSTAAETDDGMLARYVLQHVVCSMGSVAWSAGWEVQYEECSIAWGV